MNISAWSIKQPIPSIVLFILLTVLGIFSFNTLGVDENPNIDVPIISVVISQVGAAPSELETQVTKKIEDSLAGVNNIKHITSTVNEGSSSTAIEFELGTNTDRALNDVRDAVTKVRQQLPAQINEPLITRLDFIGGPLATYTVSAAPGRSIEELSWLIDNTLSRTLLGLGGVGQVQRSGGVQREISVELDPAKMESYGLTADMVNNQIRSLNIDLPGGRGGIGSEEQSIRTLGSAETIEGFRSARISLPSGGWVSLESLGEIKDGISEARQAALLNGKNVVSFSVIRSTGSNMVEVATKVDAALAKFAQGLPPDIKIDKVRTNAKYVQDSYQASMDSLIVGAVLAVIVIWIFLRDWRAALISALAMPLSVIPTFLVMKALGFTLNNMSLLGLSLVIGILVDDAIVEIENIVRHMHMGKTPYVASLEAADEIGLAVVATTASIIVVFLPVSFMPGIPGQFFRQFGLTVAIAVFFSLVVARLITPMMAAYWLKKPAHEEGTSLLVRLYDKALGWCLAYRAPTVLIALTFFLFSMGLFSLIPTSLIGNADRGELLLSVELPPGTELEDSIEASKQLSAIFLKHKDIVTRVYASVGSASSTSARDTSQGQVNKASLYIVLVPRENRKITQKEFEEQIRPELSIVPGARMSFGLAQGISGKLKVTLASDNAKTLSATANQLLLEMRGVPGLSDVNSSVALVRPEIIVKPDFAKISEQGASVQSIARTAMIATLGDVDQNLAKFDLADRQINIRVKLAKVNRDSLDSIRSLKISTAGGKLVPLGSVADVELGQGPSQIDRFDRKRQVSVEASLRSDLTLGDALATVHQLPSMKALSKDIIEKPSGDAEIQKDVFSGFAKAMGAAVLFIYAVLVLLFVGFLHPLTIMMALPLSIGGAILGLLISHESLGMYGLIGIIMLMGLSTKNSILLVEYCLMAMAGGMTRDEAIQGAGEARMRPILMTTVAMIAGMVPIAMGIGAGSEVRKSMAICVIGGLVTSTFLTLLVVPVVFTYVDDFQRYISRRRDRGGKQ
jgi:hydrophobic/amphiphilic exporter-1 (mainly G- bacteria), HAE1 family